MRVPTGCARDAIAASRISWPACSASTGEPAGATVETPSDTNGGRAVGVVAVGAAPLERVRVRRARRRASVRSVCLAAAATRSAARSSTSARSPSSGGLPSSALSLAGSSLAGSSLEVLSCSPSESGSEVLSCSPAGSSPSSLSCSSLSLVSVELSCSPPSALSSLSAAALSSLLSWVLMASTASRIWSSKSASSAVGESPAASRRASKWARSNDRFSAVRSLVSPAATRSSSSLRVFIAAGASGSGPREWGYGMRGWILPLCVLRSEYVGELALGQLRWVGVNSWRQSKHTAGQCARI